MYKKARNKLNRDIEKAKNEYFRQRLDENMDDSRKMWRVINESLKVSSKKRVAPDFVEVEDKKTKTSTKSYDKVVVANEMNAHFASVGEKLASELQATNISFKSYMKNHNPKSIFL